MRVLVDSQFIEGGEVFVTHVAPKVHLILMGFCMLKEAVEVCERQAVRHPRPDICSRPSRRPYKTFRGQLDASTEQLASSTQDSGINIICLNT